MGTSQASCDPYSIFATLRQAKFQGDLYLLSRGAFTLLVTVCFIVV